ncbi:MAG: signal peptidase I [Traorella sp.]
MSNIKNREMPTLKELEEELKKEKYKKRYRSVLKSTLYSLITVAAVAVLVATLWLPVLEIYGSSMTPTLVNGDIVISVKSTDYKQGDIVAFYYNNKILVKRVIAGPGDWINFDDEGNTYVNGNKLEEPYLEEKALGECNITLPYQVPESQLFVMGDHRSVSIDSRNKAVGCVPKEQIVGKIIFCIWPFSQLGSIK